MAAGGKLLAHHVNDAGDASERIANFVGEAGGKLAKRGQVFGAAHFAAVKFLDFDAIAFELLDHLIELASELANVVSPLGECDASGKIATPHASNGIHQVFQGPFYQDE